VGSGPAPSIRQWWEAPVFTERTSHSDLAVALRGVKIGLWSPVDAV